ncbi:putative OPA3-like protein CG13603 isoform X2 [Condylostylus longicornis]|uniref:putative OPA3-like protein CG13603 isoform X2 n=1 Tax=Condylostylus longicornis TaxID=2530218 RepID=UPI00244E5242|nr:putative OPA3-like protein CG13603 isoform X2 [Condylostylus longicornis]
MVVGAFPAAKLGVLAIKQISKPLANIIKDRAKKTPFFSKYVCMPPAQFYNWVEVKTKMWAMNLGKPVKVPQLTEAMAIELGANLLGEFIIFTIGAGLLIFEYMRQSSKEAKKEEQTLEEKRLLKQTLSELAFKIERQDAQIRELNRSLAALDSRVLFRWKSIQSEKGIHKNKNLLESTVEDDEYQNNAEIKSKNTFKSHTATPAKNHVTALKTDE